MNDYTATNPHKRLLYGVLIITTLLTIVSCSGYDDPCSRCRDQGFYNANTYYCNECLREAEE